ncbi:MAG: YiiD C-terminal domain-containing protein [Deltaproteobacteria bacterium]
MKPALETVKAMVERKVSFVERMGLQAIGLERCAVKLIAPLRGNENHVGTMYAGALFTLAEMPGGALFLTTFDSSRFYPIIKEMTIQFVRPATTDVTVELVIPEEEARRIETEAEQRGKADFILEGELKDRSGTVVARSKGVYQLRVIGT